jgi:hypothetical protein
VTHTDAVSQAFARLMEFLAGGRLAGVVASLERELSGTQAQEAAEAARRAGFQPALLEAALLIRRDLGRLNDLVHAAAITVTLPLILEPGERLTNRPSLAAGNDPTRPFDLETDRRVAEFKVGIWSGNGTDAMRKRTVFHDLVHLAADTSNRRPELYVVGPQPVRFLQRSHTTAQWALDRGAASTRQLFVERFGDLGTTVEQFVAGPAEHVRIVDLADLLPELRATLH